MHRFASAIQLPSSLLAVALLASCSTESQPGHIAVQYDFQGVESPSRVSLYLLPTSAAVDCDALSGNPFDLATDSSRSLPVSGDATFTDLDADSEWLVVGVGALDGAEVATGCVDGIKIVDNETSFVNLTLENTPVDIQGSYIAVMEFNAGLPVEVIGATLTYDAFYDDFVGWLCTILEDCTDVQEDDTQAVATELLTLYSSLDIEVEWTFAQSADLIHGEMEWKTVEGVVVDEAKWNLIEGSFSGEIPGATQILFTSPDLRINSEELTLFLLEEVMLRDTTGKADILDPVMPDMLLSTGGALAIDDDFTGQADRISGEMNAVLDFQSLGFAHSFDMIWTAHRGE
ncbi:MAG: hypothetical protein KC912_10435 [Proteobacteria bacterium]|nr:hypothetical protein [Pseudomonadota bacterium]